jgi:hypothetical protein
LVRRTAVLTGQAGYWTAGKRILDTRSADIRKKESRIFYRKTSEHGQKDSRNMV